ncbi:MAG: cytochrome C biogenesis protein [Verrucomicrobia bacterium]|nr:cytochrome C biogenesis protein [Verrucomicrobiota bacterium]
MGVTMMKWILICSIWLAVFVEAQELDFSALRAIAVQKDGRKKPLDTVANETAQRLTGRRKDAMELLLNLWLQARDWRAMPVVLLTHRELKQQLGMPVEQKYFTHEQLAAPALEAIVDRASRKDSHARNGVEREALALAQRMHTLAELARADSLAIVPHSTDGKGAWEPIPDSGPLKERLDAVRAAFLKRDSPALLALSGELDAALRAVSPSLYPSRESLAREVHYNQFHPFRKAEWLYVLAFVLLLASWPARNRAGYWAAVALFAAGVLLHAYGFYLRTMISGRPPITNMYESVVWVSFGAALFALVLEMIFRSRFCLAAVAPIAAVMLLLADMFPAVLDPGIGPLVPVLRSNFWLAVHVPAVTLGYSAFAVAMALGHVTLAYYVFKPAAQETIDRLEHFIYRAMQAGVLLLAAGSILGGIWAHYAWGRFWGWDPKETWSLISLLSYVIPLHGRLIGWLRGFGLSVASVLCFLTVLMAWYGVNFILGKGLHAYGFGTGGTPYVAAFVLLELGITAVAVYKKVKS